MLPTPSPRKAPRQARSRATFEAIVEAAARILEAGGTPALNTNLIADRAGVSVGTLYQYFPDKEAIVAELIRRERQELLDGIRAAAGPALSEREPSRLGALIQAGLDHQYRRARLARELEYLGRTLDLEDEEEDLASTIAGEVHQALLPEFPALSRNEARELVAMVRALADIAAFREAVDMPTLKTRIERAARGYLQSS